MSVNVRSSWVMRAHRYTFAKEGFSTFAGAGTDAITPDNPKSVTASYSLVQRSDESKSRCFLRLASLGLPYGENVC